MKDWSGSSRCWPALCYCKTLRWRVGEVDVEEVEEEEEEAAAEEETAREPAGVKILTFNVCVGEMERHRQTETLTHEKMCRNWKRAERL